jgi:hypothetical protein
MPEDTDSRGITPEQRVDYDAFLSHVREDKPYPDLRNPLTSTFAETTISTCTYTT